MFFLSLPLAQFQFYPPFLHLSGFYRRLYRLVPAKQGVGVLVVGGGKTLTIYPLGTSPQAYGLSSNEKKFDSSKKES